MKQLHRVADRAQLKAHSQHDVELAFNHIDFADNSRGVWGATPSDPMHLLAGVMKYIIEILTDKVTPSESIKLNEMARQLKKDLRQHNLDDLPRITLNRGVCDIAMITSDELSGLAFVFCLLMVRDDSWRILGKTLQKYRMHRKDSSPAAVAAYAAANAAAAELAVVDGVAAIPQGDDNNDGAVPHQADMSGRQYEVLSTLESLLCFRAFTKKHTLWKIEDNVDGRRAFTEACLRLQKQIIAWFPRLDKAGWFIPKFHEIQHFPRDTARFGTPRNYDSGPCEHNHIFDAKRPGRRAQKNPRTFLPQVARRVYHGLCINKLQHMMQQASPVATADTRKAPPMAVGGTRYTVDLTTDPVVPPTTIPDAEYNPVFLRWLRDT